MVYGKSISDRIFNFINMFILSVIAASTLIPFIHILCGSFSSSEAVTKGGLLLLPSRPSLAAYRYVFTTNIFVTSLGISVYITILGTMISIFFTSIMAYSLSHNRLMGHSAIMFLIIFSMLFSGGMIPNFLIIKQLGMINKLWALMIPNAISAYNLIIMKKLFPAAAERA